MRYYIYQFPSADDGFSHVGGFERQKEALVGGSVPDSQRRGGVAQRRHVAPVRQDDLVLVPGGRVVLRLEAELHAEGVAELVPREVPHGHVAFLDEGRALPVARYPADGYFCPGGHLDVGTLGVVGHAVVERGIEHRVTRLRFCRRDTNR